MSDQVLLAPAFQLNIPFPVFPKARPRLSTKDGQAHVHMPAGYKKCIRDIGMLIQSKLPRGWNKFLSYKITGCFYLDDPTQGDIDQLVGTIMDAGNGVAWYDDRQICAVGVDRMIVPPLGRQTILVVQQLKEITGFEASDRSLKAALKAGNREVARELARRDAIKARK